MPVLDVVRAHVDLEVGEVLAHGPHRAVVGAGRVQRDDRARCAVGAHRLEHLRRARVAEEDRKVLLAALRDALGAHVQRDVGHVLLAEDAANQAPHAAVARNDDVAGDAVHVALGDGHRRSVLGGHLLRDEGAELRQVRRDSHRDGHHEEEGRAELRRHDAHAHGLPECHEGKLAARPKQHARLKALDDAQAEGLARGDDHRELARDERHEHRHDATGVARKDGWIHRHAHRHEEEAQQDAAVRLDVRLDLEVVLGLGDKEARQEGAEGHRQAGGLRGH
mmetsp:Transcript_11596/g.48752  ORF Transcript_11596/g.48752 Transcript_11596/m.48752 type:complete len:279 (-) Transcript_11596:1381-2217(-)